MISKNIILAGAGGIVGFISCGAMITKKLLENDKTREALMQIICDKAVSILYEDEPKNKKAHQVSYMNYYDCYRKPHYRDYMQSYFFDDRKIAEEVLAEMQTIIENYGFVSILDLCDLCGIDKNDYFSREFGWKNIGNRKLIQVPGGWEIRLPKPIRIN